MKDCMLCTSNTSTYIYNLIISKLKSSHKTPTLIPIITVSKMFLLWNRLWDNTILLSGMRRHKSYLRYEGITETGANLCGIDLAEEVDLKSVKMNLIILLASYDEWKTEEDIPNNVIPISLSETGTTDEYVILMIASNQRKIAHEDSLWTDSFVKGIEDQFNITILGDGYKHNGSVGNYFGFGITAKYNIQGGCSYGIMAKKIGHNVTLHADYQKVLESDFTFASQELNAHVPSLVQCGQLVTQALADISRGMVPSPMHIDCFNDGMATGYICKNAQTYVPHTEKDCAYTMIIVPMCGCDTNIRSNYVFEFEWNGSIRMLKICLKPGTVLYYSGYGITHRQLKSRCSGCSDLCHDFFNLSSYGNKHLFENVMKSFTRHL